MNERTVVDARSCLLHRLQEQGVLVLPGPRVLPNRMHPGPVQAL
jgi:hypothetical protein